MQATRQQSDSTRYAKRIEISKRTRFDVNSDVIRGRKFNFSKRFQNLDSRPGSGQFHIGGSVVATTLRAVWLGLITVAAGFFVSVTITVYGGFPLWFV